MNRLLIACLLSPLVLSCSMVSNSKVKKSADDKPRVIQISEYPKVLVGKWRSDSRTLVFSKNGTWSVGGDASLLTDDGKRVWDLNANRLSLGFRGSNGEQSAEYRVSDFTDKSFVMTMDDVSEVYRRVE